ncbi:hypothetical protein LCGC14_2405330 [marine sediment metagenome]|uniref:Uncharacterized protein n=1 Tax=marine sediment metagenome TaxID=412755 RepID=A0A0F9BU57_9ZZZZ
MKRNSILLLSTIVLIGLTTTSSRCLAAERTISREVLLGKMRGFWIGQLVGNYMGFPFENIYVQKPIPFLVERYYTFRDDPSIRLNRDDLRGYVPIVAHWLEGAISDDDTDNRAHVRSCHLNTLDKLNRTPWTISISAYRKQLLVYSSSLNLLTYLLSYLWTLGQSQLSPPFLASL